MIYIHLESKKRATRLLFITWQ